MFAARDGTATLKCSLIKRVLQFFAAVEVVAPAGLEALLA